MIASYFYCRIKASKLKVVQGRRSYHDINKQEKEEGKKKDRFHRQMLRYVP
jgi:hypothetical protein